MSETRSDSYQDDSAELRADRGSDIGGLLRASRLRIGEDLRDVSDALRISYRYLEDIEAGRFESLPGTTYAIGFIRTYADHLGLDGDEVVRRFKEEVSASKDEANLEFPAPIAEAGIPAGALIFVGLIIAVLAYGAWYVSTTEKGFIAELISPLPERLAEAPSTNELEPATPGAGRPEDRPGAQPAAQPAAQPDEASAPDGDTATSAAAPAAEEAAPATEMTDTAAPPQPAMSLQTEQTEQAAQADSPAPESASTESAPTESASTESTSTESAFAEPAPPPESAAPMSSEPAPAEATSEPSSPPSDSAAEPAPAENAETEPATAPEPAAESTAESAAAPASESARETGTGESATAMTAPEKKKPATDTESAPPQEEPRASEESAPRATAETAAPETASQEPASQEPAGQRPTPPAPPQRSEPQTPSQVATAAQREIDSGASSSGEMSSGRVYGTENADARIVVRAKMNSWIQVRDDKANRLLLTRLLRRGDSYRVPNRAGLKLLAGNAGALEILVDGEPVPAIGPQGAVRRSVALDAERLQQGKAVIE